ncbi:conserved protein of unknown function [Nitratireductor aquimarinus]|uniref:hypothetical protein n=1 Tax=Nitratireductor aquimarinus TaxID=889300 RepID=UPI003B5B5B60
MDAIEKAIRKAFEKGDADKRSFREKVYRSAFAALERTLEAREDLSDEARLARRENLKATITEIETEFVPAAAPRRPAAPEPEAPQRQEPRPAPRQAPSPQVTPEVAPQVAPGVTPEPRRAQVRRAESDFTPQIDRADRPSAPDQPSDAETKRRIRAALPRQRRPYAMLFLVATLVAFVAMGLWWTFSSGILMSSAERDTSVPNPPLALEEEEFSTGSDETTGSAGASGTSRAAGEWITVFDPTDPTTVAASNGGNVDVMRNDDRVFLRISTAGNAGVTFDVGQGILETLAGRSAIFSIEARSQDGEETQLSLSCNFGALGGCGRTRYVVGPSRADYLFEVTLPDERPNGGGAITIVPDVTGGGKALDIFAIRAAVATQ